MPTQKITKEEIIGKAIQLFRQSGYHATSIQHLAEACDIRKAHLYYYFPKGKQEILQSVLSAVHTYFNERVFHYAFQEALAPVERFELIMNKLQRVLLGGKGGCLMANTILELVHNPEFQHIKPIWKQYVEDAIQAFYHLFEPILGPEEAMEQAEFLLQDIEGGLILSQLYEDHRFVLKAFQRGLNKFPSATL